MGQTHSMLGGKGALEKNKAGAGRDMLGQGL